LAEKLFNQENIEKIKKEMEHWEKEILKGGAGDKEYYTEAGIPMKLLYTPVDIANMNYLKDLGFSGAPPFVRGVYPNMYRGRLFTVRQLAGFGSAADCNKRFKFLLANGATGVSALFDLPTIRGYDSDDPEAEGNIGECGVAIDSVEDIMELFDGIPIDEVSVSVVTHLPSTTVAILAMYLVMAERRGISFAKLAGTNQNDFIMETCVGSAPEILPPSASFRLQCDAIEYSVRNLPRWNPVSYNGYNLREAGTTSVMEVGVALANAIATGEEMVKRGLGPDEWGRRLSFFWDLCNDFFEEIAKCRASRKVFYDLMKNRFGAKNERSMLMRYHVQTAGITLTAMEPLNNIARSAIQGLAAILGGAQSLHIDSFDEAYSAPTEEAALVALRTQQILQVETNVVNTVDPLAGSYYVESLTNEMVKRIEDYIADVESRGGLVKAVESGWMHREIADYAYEYQRGIESGEQKVVGVNYYRNEERKQENIDVFRYPETAPGQIAKIKKLKASRDNAKVKETLDVLRSKCHSNENLVPYAIEAVRANATLGEIEEVFRTEFGLWQFPLI
jgi:methylmalonyl-CoA mutase N-terminal domain/subunit